MEAWIYVDILVFITVVLLTGILIPQILLIAFRKNLLDHPDPRKIHTVSVPRLGGIAFFPSVLFTVMLAIGLMNRYCPSLLEIVDDESVKSLCFLTGAIVTLYLVGIADDLVGLKYRAKFAAQLISASLILTGGLSITNLHGFLTIEGMPQFAEILLTVLLTIFITNAINLIDGIDGLASGLSAIAFGFYGFVFYKSGLHIYAMISFAVLGTLIPFFYYNVFGNAEKHGKIFMGDTGALTIGLLLSVMSIRICDIPNDVVDINPAVLAFDPLLIPCCDVVRVYIHRVKANRNPFLPDKTHIHHKLLALGMTPQMAMPAIVITSLLLTFANYSLSQQMDLTILFMIDIAFWIVTNMVISRAVRRRNRRLAFFPTE